MKLLCLPTTSHSLSVVPHWGPPSLVVRQSRQELSQPVPIIRQMTTPRRRWVSPHTANEGLAAWQGGDGQATLLPRLACCRRRRPLVVHNRVSGPARLGVGGGKGKQLWCRTDSFVQSSLLCFVPISSSASSRSCSTSTITQFQLMGSNDKGEPYVLPSVLS